MCGRIIQSSGPLRLAIVEGLNTPDSRVSRLKPRYNGAPSQELLVIRENHETGQRSLDLLRWGLIPHGCEDEAGGRKPINAKAETVARLPTFRDAYARRRSVVPVDGFFEWHSKEGGRSRRPYAVAMRDGSPFGIGGLWENWKSTVTGQWVRTFCIITTPANVMVSRIHDRMPLILARADHDRCGCGRRRDLGRRNAVERLAPRFRQQGCGDDYETVGDAGIDADRGAERDEAAHIADQDRQDRRENAAEIVAETDPAPANAGRIEFVEQRAHAGGNAGGEEPQRKSQDQHRGVPDRQQQIADRNDRAADGEHRNRPAPAEPIEELPGGHAAAPERDDDDPEIESGAHHRETALGFEECRQPGEQAIVAAVSAEAEQPADQRDPQRLGGENAEQRPGEALVLRGRRPLRLGNRAAHVEDQQCREQSDGEQDAPGELLRSQREYRSVKQHRSAPSYRPTALHRAKRLAAMRGPDHLAHQHGAGRPLGAKA